MGLLGTISKAFGITEMKADDVIADVIDPVDAARLRLKQIKEKLIKAKKSMTDAREQYFLEKQKLQKDENELETIKNKLVQVVNRYRKQGMTDEEIKAKIAPVQANVSDQINQLNARIATQSQVVATHDNTVKQFENVIQRYDAEIKKDDSEFSILQSQFKMADTKTAIAEAMNELNIDGTADDIALLRAKTEEMNARADAAMASATASQSVDDSLDALLLDSQSTSSSELDALLGFDSTPALPVRDV